MPSAPTIVLGMHRSGTTALVEALARLGLFLGATRDENHEALFFQRLNIWMMESSGARWDLPTPMHYFWQQPELVEASAHYVSTLLEGRAARSFWGRGAALRRPPAARAAPWGWKDPRNTFTAPLWLRLFPDARVLSIRRHGVDVAASLRRRARRSLESTLHRFREPRLDRLARPRRRPLAPTARCLSLEGAFSLWREYTDEAECVLASVPAHRRRAIRFEELLAEPRAALAELCDFCGLRAGEAELAEPARLLDAGRALPFRADAELSAFAARKRAELREHGYEG